MARGDGRRRLSVPALLAYAAAWLAAAAALAALVLGVLRTQEDDVALPPVQATELGAAAAAAGCELRVEKDRDAQPPASGPPAGPAPARVYEQPPPVRTLVGALRRGIIVIHYRPDLPDDAVQALQTLSSALPRGTILTPNARMRFAIAVTAWRRVLGCPGLTRRSLDAIRLFRGRFVGSGPDGPAAPPPADG